MNVTIDQALTLPAAYQADHQVTRGEFIVIEGISGSGKSTIARILGEVMPARTLHVIPAPLTELTGYINTRARVLPQFAFYLTGVLHAGDTVREWLQSGPVVADRYINSVIANHAAVNGLDHRNALALAAPYLPYLPKPLLTVYLNTSEAELRTRMAAKPDLNDNDRQLLADRDMLNEVIDLYNTSPRATRPPST